MVAWALAHPDPFAAIAAATLGFLGLVGGRLLGRKQERMKMALEERRTFLDELRLMVEEQGARLERQGERIERLEADNARVGAALLAVTAERDIERVYTAMLLAWAERGAPPPPPNHPGRHRGEEAE